MTTKPIILFLGDPKDTIRWRTSQFKTFSSNFTIKVNEDTTRSSFTKALQEKKYPKFYVVNYRYGDFIAIMKPMVEYGAEFGRLDKPLIDLLPSSLKVIAAGGAGFDWVEVEELGKRGTCLLF
jgi:lactate dehydrogenase-like 2-hydroxyacid dehydrogenase